MFTFWGGTAYELVDDSIFPASWGYCADSGTYAKAFAACPAENDVILEGIATNLWHTNDNVLAIRAVNCGGDGFVDVRVSPEIPSGVITNIMGVTNVLTWLVLPPYTNQPPVVSAGPSQSTGGSTVMLQGMVADDGWPTNDFTTATWSKVSGPGNVSFDPNPVDVTNWAELPTTANMDATGTYVFQLVADDGQYSTTDTVTVYYVDTNVYLPPTVNFVTPANNQTFWLGVPIPIGVTATASTGTIARVEFYAYYGTQYTLIGTATHSPFSMTWNNAPTGPNTITAVAYDSGGRVTGISEGIQVNPHLPPVAVDDEMTVETDSKNNYLNVLSNDYDPEANPVWIAAVTAPAYGKVRIINNGTALAFTPEPGTRGHPGEPADGFHYEVTDKNGGTSWATVAMIVNGEDIPEINLSVACSVTNAGAVDPISATVSPSDKIAKVDFYLGQTLIGEVTNGSGGGYGKLGGDTRPHK